MVSKRTAQRRRNSKRQKRRSLKRKNVKSRKVMRGGGRWDKLKQFFQRPSSSPSRESAYRVPETTTPQTHEMIIENHRRDQIFKLYQDLPTYRYHYTGPQPENMLKATLYYVMAYSASTEEKTIPCMCGICIYSNPDDIMVVIITSERFVESGYEYQLSPRIDNGDLILTIPEESEGGERETWGPVRDIARERQRELERIKNGEPLLNRPIWTDETKQHSEYIRIKQIIILKNTIDEGIERERERKRLEREEEAKLRVQDQRP